MTSDLVTYLRALDTAICQRNEARAEIERQARHIEELREKIDAERSCACSFDAPGDVCAAHSPALMQARAEVERLRAALRDALDGLRYWVPQTSVGAVERCRIVERAIEALEAKP